LENAVSTAGPAIKMPNEPSDEWWIAVIEVCLDRSEAVRAEYERLVDRGPHACGVLAMACELMRGSKDRDKVDLRALAKNGGGGS
jgi:hypothetical protein